MVRKARILFAPKASHATRHVSVCSICSRK
jgi:hypothetical protein